MSYSSLRGLGWLMDEYASLGLTDSESITTKALCGNAKVIQSALKDQGFYNGAIDGILGSGSVTAIKNFSASAGIGSKSWPDAAFCSALRSAQEKKLAAAWEAAHPPAPAGGGGAPGDQGGSYVATPDAGVVGVSQPGSASSGGSTSAPAAAGMSQKTILLGAAGVLGVLGVGCLIYAATRDGGGGEGEMRANRRGSRRRARRSSKRGRRRSSGRRAGRRGGRRQSKRWKSYWAGVAKLAPAHRWAARTGRPVPAWAQY